MIKNSYNKLTHLDLSIQLSLNGFSFSILDKESNTIIKIKTFNFNKKLIPLEVLDKLKTVFEEAPLLNNNFDNITVIHDNDLSTLVPKSLFNKDHLANYLKFNSKILRSDFIAHDIISENNSINVYVPYVNINNYIYDKFGEFTFKHVSSILIESILQIEKNTNATKIYVHINNDHFEIITLEKGDLKLYNRFTHNSKEDFIYYILFTAEQLNLDPETLNLVLIGDISHTSDLYDIAYKYIRNINFGDRNDNFTYINAPKSKYSNFTLLKSF